jgi:uncharacterized coiled-coil protein SlyX
VSNFGVAHLAIRQADFQAGALMLDHELEMAKLRDLLRLLTEKVKATQPSQIASQSEETPPPHY